MRNAVLDFIVEVATWTALVAIAVAALSWLYEAV